MEKNRGFAKKLFMNQLESVLYTPQLTRRLVDKATLPALLMAACTARCPHLTSELDKHEH
jgi:hypothetical protein